MTIVISDFYKKGESTIYFEYDRVNDRVTIKTTTDSTQYIINNASTDIGNYDIRIYESTVYDPDTGVPLYDNYHDLTNLSELASFKNGGTTGQLGVRTIDGTAGSDLLTGSAWNDTISAGTGDDTILAVRGNNVVDAGDGNDLIYVTNGTVTGGIGNDTINISSQFAPWNQTPSSTPTNYNPVVINFNKGDGQDTIINNFRYVNGITARPTADTTIQFGAGIVKEDLKFKQVGEDLVILVGGTDDAITLKDYFSYVQVDGKPSLDTAIIDYYLAFDNGTKLHITGDQIINANNPNEVYPLDKFLEFDSAINESLATKGQRITGTDGDDTITGSSGNDVIKDIAGHNYIDAGAGKDNITGTGTIKGGASNDVINIKESNSLDTIIFGFGDGKDVINSYDNLMAQDTLRFGPNVTKADLSFKRAGNDLIIMVGTSGQDQLTLKNYFRGAEYQTITKFEFTDANGNIIANQTVHDLRDAMTAGYVFNFNGTAKGDNIVGSLWNDSITAGAGNDKITGAGTIIGGQGNDVINIKTEGSSDTIVFNTGDGKDVINSYDSLKTTDTLQFGAGISAADLTYTRKGNHLVIQVGSSGKDQMTINNFFKGEEYQTLHRIEFASGDPTIVDFRNEVFDIVGNTTKGNTIVGTGLVNSSTRQGSDSLVGGDRNDKITGAGTIIGGKGNDVVNIKTEGSSDTIVFNTGDGKDVINSYDSLKTTDTLQFGAGISAADLTYIRRGNHLVIQVGSSGKDQMTINNFFKGEEYQTLHKVEFLDSAGNVIGAQTINDFRNGVFDIVGNTTKGNNIIGTGLVNKLTGQGSDSLVGGDRNDKITGAGTIRGGKGNDVINIQVAGSSDTIHYKQGDGKDVINSLDKADTKGYDTIVFDDLDSTDVTYERKGNHLILKASDGGQLTINNYFKGADYQTINIIRFNDGVWSLHPQGGANGFITAGSGATVPSAPATSTADNFTFAAGDGNKVFSSYDPYLTQDTLTFTGINSTDVSYQKRGNHLIVVVKASGEEITLKNFFVNPAYQTINKFEFVDTIINDIRQYPIDFDYSNATKGQTIIGTPWTTELVGGEGNDRITGKGIITGGKGNDVINIKAIGSADTIIYNKGDGNDVINSYDITKTQDTLELHDIALADVSFARSPRTFVYYLGWKETYDLIITVNTTGEKITIKNYFRGEEYRTISHIVFKDNTGVTTDTLDFTNSSGHFTFEGIDGKSQRLVGSLIAGKDYIDAKDGNDVILGAGTIIGGKGNDNISIKVNGSADEIRFDKGDGKDVINSLDKAVNKGQDTIVFGGNVTVDDVVVSRKGNSLILTVGADGDQITVNNYFAGANYQTITKLTFADGSYWDLTPTGGEHGLVTKHNAATPSQPVSPFATSLIDQVDSLVNAMAGSFPVPASQNNLVDDKSLDFSSSVIAVGSH